MQKEQNLLQYKYVTNQSAIRLIIYRLNMYSSKTVLEYEHFRNAISQSWVQKGEFHGIGFIVTDQAEILLGEFQNGDLHGWYLLLAEDHYSYGSVNKNKLDGFSIIKTTESTIYGTFKNDLLEGLAVIVSQSKNRIEVVQYEKGRQTIQVDEKPLAGTSLSQILTKHLGKFQLTPRQFLSSKVCKLEKYQIFEKQIGTNLRYFGYINNQKNLGLVFNGDFLQSFGEFNDYELKGLGRFIQFNGRTFDGLFQDGDWTQQGVQFISRSINTDKEVTSFRKQHHLKQMKFNNCHFILKQFLNIGNIDMNPPQKFSSVQQLLKIRSRRTTSSFREQSPLKQKLRTYQKQATKYLNNEQNPVRPYTRTVDIGKYQMSPPSPQNTSVSSANNPKQSQSAQDDIYELVKKMQFQQQVKRNQLNQIIRIRTKTIL